MARPTKTGLEYFPLDVDMDQDDKLFFIEAKHGLIGFAVVVRLLMLIYKDGYYKQYTEDKEAFMLAKRLSVEVNVLNNIINDCINEDIFNKKLFEQYGILTSRGIQKRYLEACARRKEVNIFKEYCLIDPKNYKNLVFEYINPVIVDINPDKCNTVSAETLQSKVKESKVKESKEKEDTSLQIKNLRSRYSEEQSKAIDEYFDILRWTRKNGRIADSVILKIYQEWEKYPIPKVIYALKVYINNPKYHDKRENYCYGIMRNVTADEIAKGEDYGKSKRDNGQDVGQYAGIGLTLEDLQGL